MSSGQVNVDDVEDVVDGLSAASSVTVGFACALVIAEASGDFSFKSQLLCSLSQPSESAFSSFKDFFLM